MQKSASHEWKYETGRSKMKIVKFYEPTKDTVQARDMVNWHVKKKG